MDGVTVTLGDALALAPVSFTVTPQEPLAVVGPNGSGKTTLLRVLAGILTATSGTATVDGCRADERDRRFRAKVAALIGIPPLAFNLTLLEHLTLVGVSWGAKADTARARGLELMETFGVAPLSSRFPHELSSGQTQMFALALTLARPFEVLLLDEPEQRLDADRVAVLVAILRDVAAQGTALVVASHSRTLTDGLGGNVLSLTESGTASGR